MSGGISAPQPEGWGMSDGGKQGGQVLRRRTRPPEADKLLRCEGSVAMVAEAGERAKGEVAAVEHLLPKQPCLTAVRHIASP